LFCHRIFAKTRTGKSRSYWAGHKYSHCIAQHKRPGRWSQCPEFPNQFKVSI
jgi:hypothetical protein